MIIFVPLLAAAAEMVLVEALNPVPAMSMVTVEVALLVLTLIGALTE